MSRTKDWLMSQQYWWSPDEMLPIMYSQKNTLVSVQNVEDHSDMRVGVLVVNVDTPNVGDKNK